MNTRQLTYLITIAEQGNLSGAAQKLGVSQPALSKYLSGLEAELGTDLFLRHKKRLYLTAAGKIYMDAASRILAVKDQTYQAIASLSGSYKKTITVGVTPLRGAIAVSRLFPVFHRRYPDVNIEMKEAYSSELRQGVVSHSLDLALGTCIDLEDPELLRVSCHDEEMLLYVPSFHPLAPLANRDPAHLTSMEIARFVDTPFLLGGPGSTMRRLAEDLFRQNRMQPTIVYEANNNLILKNMAMSGAGVTILSRAHMENTPDLVYFRIKPGYYIRLTVMLPKDRPVSEEIRYLIALNFYLESGNSYYRLNPSPLATEYLHEFSISLKGLQN